MEESVKPVEPAQPRPRSLKEAVHKARIEEAERADVIVHLHAAEAARLELLREALAPVFAEIPEDAMQFEPVLQKGDPPRLWIDMVAYVVMGRDRQTYRFVQDTRLGRKILLESADVDATADCVTAYLAKRLVEREKALAADEVMLPQPRPMQPHQIADAPAPEPEPEREAKSGGRGGKVLAFLVGIVVGAVGLVGAAPYVGQWLNQLR